MKAIIFGIHGQDGFYLSELLKKNGVSVIGVSRSNGDWIKGSVADFVFVEDLIKRECPEYIFHLAADSTTQHTALFENHASISTGAMNILEAAWRHSKKTKIFLAGSAMQFANAGAPIDENTPFDAGSPYAAARIYSTYLGRYYRKLGVAVYNGYLFNHDSPLRTERHINKKIAEAVKRIRTGSKERIAIGDIDIQKEFNYAGDIIEAVWILVNQDRVFEAVIGSGEVHSIKEWTEYCFKKVGLNWENFVDIKPDYTPEYNVLVSNPHTIKELGWSPKVNFSQLADMMME